VPVNDINGIINSDKFSRSYDNLYSIFGIQGGPFKHKLRACGKVCCCNDWMHGFYFSHNRNESC